MNLIYVAYVVVELLRNLKTTELKYLITKHAQKYRFSFNSSFQQQFPVQSFMKFIKFNCSVCYFYVLIFMH